VTLTCLFSCYCEFVNDLCTDAIRISGCKWYDK